MSQPTRETLLMRLRHKRDDLSWEEFVTAYERYIYLLIRGMKMGHHDAEDLVQGVMLAIWQKIPEFEYNPDRSKFRTWICRITRNKVVDYIRSSTSESNKLNNFVLEESSLPEIEQLAENEWKAHVTDKAWEIVQKSFQSNALDCFTLLKKGESVENIAQKLEISESSVYVYSKRVKDKLIREIRLLDEMWT